MNESITRAAGAEHGQEWPPSEIESAIVAMGRNPQMRTTLYKPATEERRSKAFAADELQPCHNDGALKKQRSKKLIAVSAIG